MTVKEFDTQLNIIKNELKTDKHKYPTEEEYKLIEYVYNFHPSISETEGKKQVAYLYENFGIAIFRDMEPRANYMRSKEGELAKLRTQMNKVRREMQEAREGTEDNLGGVN